MIRPPRLQPGDHVGIVAPAGPVKKSRLEQGAASLRKLGFTPVFAENIYDRSGYLAGEDSDRLEGLNRMFADPRISGIICARGGFGSIRILEDVDYKPIRQNPKVFVGYSDITLLHLAIYKLCHLVTFHGPMLAVDFYKLSAYNRKYFLKAVSSTAPVGKIQNSSRLGRWKVISPGRASAPILGGNLTLLTRLLGTKYEPDFRNKLLFLEDLREEPYKVDSMLGQLKMAGILKQVKGVVLAEFIDSQPSKKASFSLEEVFRYYFAKAPYPVIHPVSCGHGADKITMPLGVKASLDTRMGIFSIDQAGVV